MADPSKPTAPRIAIKFGGPASTKSTNGSQKPSRPEPASSLGKRSRPHALGGDSDSGGEEDDLDRRGSRSERITGFGGDRAEKSIPRLANRNWKNELKAKRAGYLPEEARIQKNGDTKETEVADEDKPIKWGLTIKGRREKDVKDESQSSGDVAPKDEETEPNKPQNADDEAMDALLGKKRGPQRTIQLTEQDALQRDIKDVGDDATLDDYEDMPVEDFGAALLRGMGWNGQKNTRPKDVARRENNLGLGAKSLNGKEDLGEWGQKKRRPRLDEYNREAERKKSERDRRRDGHRDSDRGTERGRDSFWERDGYKDRNGSDRDRDRHRH